MDHYDFFHYLFDSLAFNGITQNKFIVYNYLCNYIEICSFSIKIKNNLKFGSNKTLSINYINDELSNIKGFDGYNNMNFNQWISS